MKTVILSGAIVASLFLTAGCGGEDPAPGNPQELVTSPAPESAEPDIDAMIEVDEYPSPLTTVNPAYPEDARTKGIEGMVWLKVLVNKQGTVTKAVVAKRAEGTESMEKAAIDAAKQWTFKPATVKAETVSVWVAIPFKFKLGDKK
jgi:protein TonB